MELFGFDKRLITPHPLTGRASELFCRQGCVGVLFVWLVELGNNIEAWGNKIETHMTHFRKSIRTYTSQRSPSRPEVKCYKS